MSSKLLTHLSQSFFIDQPTFITKLDLFFSSKDSSLPVKLNIRRNNDGRPTGEILNFSQILIDSANVNISDDANTATTVSFASPVFLDTGEYSINLGSDSRSYNVYVAELNGTDITTTRKITQQPALGTFYQTETLASFTPSTFEDLKFNLYRAKFYTNVTANVNLVPTFMHKTMTGTFGGLDTDPLELFRDKHIMKVYQFNHGFVNGSNVRISDVANTMSNADSMVADVSSFDGRDSKMDGGNIFGLDGNIFNLEFEVSNVKLDSYTVDLGSDNIPVLPTDEMRHRFGGPFVSVGKDINYTSVTPRISTYLSGNTSINHTIRTTRAADYDLSTTYESVKNLSENKFDNEKTFATLDNLEAKMSNNMSLFYNIKFNSNNDRVSPLIDTKQMGLFLKRNLVNNTNYSATVLEHELTTLSNVGDGNQGGEKANIYVTSANFGIINLTTTSDMDNANGVINGSILNVQANTSQTTGSGANNSGLYRVIDVVTGNSNNVNIKVAKITGNIDQDIANNNVYSIVNSNDYITEEAAVGGTTYSKYITREVTFNNPSTAIRLILDASVPLNSNLDFYYKTKLAGDSTNLNEIEYKKVSDITIPNSLDGSFVEFQKTIDNIDAFNSIVFKVVFNANNTADAPKIKNFRIIAVS